MTGGLFCQWALDSLAAIGCCGVSITCQEGCVHIAHSSHSRVLRGDDDDIAVLSLLFFLLHAFVDVSCDEACAGCGTTATRGGGKGRRGRAELRVSLWLLLWKTGVDVDDVLSAGCFRKRLPPASPVGPAAEGRRAGPLDPSSSKCT